MSSKETCWNIVNHFNQHAQQEAQASAFSMATVCCHMWGGDNNKEACAQTHHCAANSLNFSPLWISAALGAVNMRAIYPAFYKVGENQPMLRRGWTTLLAKSNAEHVGAQHCLTCIWCIVSGCLFGNLVHWFDRHWRKILADVKRSIPWLA